MSIYVVWREDRYAGEFQECYWTGEFTIGGAPSVTKKLSKAAKYQNPRHAYDEAGAYKKLASYRVSPRRLGA